MVNGLDIPAVLAHKSEHGTLAGYAAADAITNEELLALECDVLAPCALEQAIHGRRRVGRRCRSFGLCHRVRPRHLAPRGRSE